jgi:hypothetical protein
VNKTCDWEEKKETNDQQKRCRWKKILEKRSEEGATPRWRAFLYDFEGHIPSLQTSP